jgi:hypothetical protein
MLAIKLFQEFHGHTSYAPAKTKALGGSEGKKMWHVAKIFESIIDLPVRNHVSVTN